MSLEEKKPFTDYHCIGDFEDQINNLTKETNMFTGRYGYGKQFESSIHKPLDPINEIMNKIGNSYDRLYSTISNLYNHGLDDWAEMVWDRFFAK